uniref:Uncharacterized protein n=1 Tax=Romanomermis culicivorax TaxID=13658 RepID=A0A915KV90_ROMCU
CFGQLFNTQFRFLNSQGDATSFDPLEIAELVSKQWNCDQRHAAYGIKVVLAMEPKEKTTTPRYVSSSTTFNHCSSNFAGLDNPMPPIYKILCKIGRGKSNNSSLLTNKSDDLAAKRPDHPKMIEIGQKQGATEISAPLPEGHSIGVRGHQLRNETGRRCAANVGRQIVDQQTAAAPNIGWYFQ